MRILDAFPQGSEEWLQQRLLRITASEASRIMTPGGKLSSQRFDVMAELVAARRVPDDTDPEHSWIFTGNKFCGNKFTDHGNETEDEAREAFKARFPHLDVTEAAMCVHDNNFAACSPDGLISRPDGEVVAGLEIKCKCLKEHVKTLYAGEMPKTHLPQIHWSLMVTGLPEWHFWSYFPGEEPFHQVIRANGETDRARECMEQFILEYADYKTRAESLLRPEPVREESLV